MIITQTPYRISLFGGGTDYPAWYERHGGSVVSFSIDKYCYTTVRKLPPFFFHKYRVVYSKIETVSEFEDIQHPVIREVIRKYAPQIGLEIHYDGDLPARSGVGSSSAFAVGLIHALRLFNNLDVTALELAGEAIWLEQEVLKEHVGSQDQLACALGGLNEIKFGINPSFEVFPIDLSKNFLSEIEERMVLVYSGKQRSSNDISATLVQNFSRQEKLMNRTMELAEECGKLIRSRGDLDNVGEMLEESWEIKDLLNSRAVTKEFREMRIAAKEAGAIGGKIVGAGGGGFMLFWLKKGKKEDFLRNFKNGLNVPISISQHGSTAIVKGV
jgi:D-glycero-alpha-D-manno-heptose-7-phosphate kinase